MKSLYRGSAASVLLLTLSLGACAQDRADPAHATRPDDQRMRVENGLLQAVTFEGEDNTYSVGERMAHYKVPGMAFALLDDGRLAWAAGYGVLQAGSSQPVIAETRFQAASIAKPVVAAGVMRMRDAGILDLDADVQGYLTDFRIPDGEQSPGNPVTLRKLLSHTAGITPGGYGGYAPGEPLPSDLEILRGDAPANSPPLAVESMPGTRVAYSGGGYSLVEVLVQNLTGTDFTSAMNNWILGPTGMGGSTFAQPLPTDHSRNVATGHLGDGSPVAGRWRVHPEQAAAGLWTTVRDLAGFVLQIRDAYLRGTAALERPSAAELLTEQLDGQGIGFVLEGTGETLTFSHAGGNLGFRAFMVMHVPSGDGAVFMTNGDQGMAVGHEMLRAASAAYGWSTFKPQTARRASVEATEIPALLGTYDFGDGVRVVIGVEDDSLLITFPNGDMYTLVPTGAQEFVAPETGLQVTFDGTDNRRILTVYGDQGVRLETPPGG